MNREEFVVVGWTDPEGARPYLGALLLAYYDDNGELIYVGRAGAGISDAELEKLWRRLQPLAIDKCLWTCRRREPADLAHRWCFRGCIGSDRNSSPK